MPSPGEDYQSWSTVAADNGVADALINWIEGQTRASVNNSSRSELAAHAKNRNLINGSIVTTGAVNAQAFLSGVNYTAMPPRLLVKLKVGAGLTNTGPTTLNMDGLGGVTIVDTKGLALGGGELTENTYTDLLWDGTNWVYLYSQDHFKDLIFGGGGLVIGTRVFAAPGNDEYIPDPAMECCMIECIGGGAGAGGYVGNPGVISGSGGGGSGAYSRILCTIATIGPSQAIIVGAGGVGGTATIDGSDGGDTSVGTLCLAKGGLGGKSVGGNYAGGAGGSISGATGDVASGGAPGGHGFNMYRTAGGVSGGFGGSSAYGGGGTTFIGTDGVLTPGGNATAYGSGGGGATGFNVSTNGKGGDGSAGVIIITEYAGRGVPGPIGATGPIGPAGPSGSGTGDVLITGTPVAGQYALWTDASHIQGVAVTAGFGPPQGRLTLQTATPVMTTTQAAKTTIYYTPYVGVMVPLYSGSAFVMTAITELSQTTTDATKSPGAVAANTNYDLFVWNDAGTIRCTRGPAWTNDTSRSVGTTLTRVNGIWLNNASITNGPAAQRGTYVGTVRSNAASQIDWIYAGAAASGGTTGYLDVWNAYNRVDVETCCMDTSDRVSSGGLWFGNVLTRVCFVSGLAEDAFHADYRSAGFNTSTYSLSGIGYDSTTAKSGTTGYLGQNTGGSLAGQYSATALGAHFVNAIDFAQGSTATFFGNAGTAEIVTGLWFKFKM